MGGAAGVDGCLDGLLFRSAFDAVTHLCVLVDIIKRRRRETGCRLRWFGEPIFGFVCLMIGSANEEGGEDDR